MSDAGTGRPLAGATAGDSIFLVVSDKDGIIRIPGSFERPVIIVRHLGYQDQQVRLTRDFQEVRLQPDYLLLETVTVNAYQSLRPIRDVSSSFSQLSLEEVPTLGATGLVNAVNALPGIRMERRSPGSYRINVRGSTLRSPFGVRNVKIYFNQIPVTEPGGNTPLNMLDMEHLSSLSVIRSPASSLYGAGTGGVIFFDLEGDMPEGTSGLAELGAGSYGYRNWHASVRHRNEDNHIRLMAGGVQTDGYRDHTEMNRRNLGVQGNLSLGEQHDLSYLALYNDLFYELPGGLTREQRDEDPTQARQIAMDRQSSLDQQYFISGVSHRWDWNEQSGVRTAVFYSQSAKRNPFITNYEFEDLNGAGLRSYVFHEIRMNEASLKLTGGGEWQWARFRANNFGNDGGQPDTLRYVDDTRMFTGFEFLQADLEAGRWLVTGGLSINHLIYKFNRVKDVALDSSYRVDRSFNIEFSPRLGLTRRFGKSAVFMNISWGFSPPTQDEVRTSDGAINVDLEAERALSVEAGARSDLLPGRLTADLTFFHIRQNNTIVSQVDEAGNSLFINSGETLHRGLELLLTGNILRKGQGVFREINARGSLSWNHLEFTEYVREQGGENVDFSGNELTGGVPLSYFLEATAGLTGDFRLTLSHQYTSAIPLNDRNTVYSRPYHLVRLNVEKQFFNGRIVQLLVYAGVDNLLDERYSLGNDLNAFGERYFNPSPARNYYGGVRLIF